MLLIVEDIARELKQRYAVDLDSYESRFLITKIRSRIATLGITPPGQYLDYFRKTDGEAALLLQEITVNVSSFFRNASVYAMLEHTLLPKLIAEKQTQGSREIRIWSAGCATGEEPYSIAILLHKILKEDLPHWKLHIFGTDIDQSVLNAAAKGSFLHDQLLEARLEFINDYFQLTRKKYIIKPVIRQMVNFSFDDLTASDQIAPAAAIFSSFDLVMCRNVMIYFTELVKTQAICKFSKSLVHNGYLILGESEWIPNSAQFNLVDIEHKNKIYRRQ